MGVSKIGSFDVETNRFEISTGVHNLPMPQCFFLLNIETWFSVLKEEATMLRRTVVTRLADHAALCESHFF